MNWKRAITAASFSVPLIALLAWGFTRDPNEIPSPLPGREAPDFTLEVFSEGEQPVWADVGDTVQLVGLRGNIVIVNFWASWCLACRDEHRALTEVARRYARDSVRFVGVLYQDQISTALKWITRMGGQSYPALDDPSSRAAIGFGLYGVPETFVIDQQGRVAYKHVGPVTEQLLERVIQGLRPQDGQLRRRVGP